MGARARSFAAGFSWDESARGVLEVLRRKVVGSSGFGLESGSKVQGATEASLREDDL